MILTFSPQQHACKVAQVFDAPWWMSETLVFPDDKEEDTSSKAPDEKKTDADTDTKSSDNKESPKNSQQKSRRPNCNNGAKSFFQPCRGYNRSVRLARKQANNDAQQKKNTVTTRTIEQRTPIHMHEETPQVAKMSLDVTGFNPQDIAVHVEDRVVSIRGQRTNKLGDVFVVDRKFRLKNTASVDGVTASFEDGILEVTVPKKSIAGCRKIPIVVSSDDETVTALKASSLEETSTYENKVEISNDKDEEAEGSPSTKDTNAEENQEEEGIPIKVEDKQDDETKDDESADDKEVETTATTSDEAWEEVSN